MRLLKTITDYASINFAGGGAYVTDAELGDRVAMEIQEGTVQMIIVHATTLTNLTGGASVMNAYGVANTTDTINAAATALPLRRGYVSGTGLTLTLEPTASSGPTMFYVGFIVGDSGRGLISITCPYTTFTITHTETAGTWKCDLYLYGDPRRYNEMKVGTVVDGGD